jgi:hypothetical protein
LKNLADFPMRNGLEIEKIDLAFEKRQDAAVNSVDAGFSFS